MPPEELTKLYPTARKMDPTQTADAKQRSLAASLLSVERYEIVDQKVGPLSDCSVVFQFFRDALMQVEFYCEDKDAAAKYLEGEFGAPSSKSARAWFWFGGTSVVSYNPHSGIFAFADKAANQTLQMELLGRLMTAQQTPAAGESDSAVDPKQ
jgi:hypothetical protein